MINHLFTLLVATIASLSPTSHFDSADHGFSVNYPSTWNELRNSISLPSRNRLDIINFPNIQRIEALVIKHGGAEIILERGEVKAELQEGDKVIDHRAIYLPSTAFCPVVSATRIETAVVTADEVPDHVAVYQDATSYSCSARNKHFVLLLRHWKDDPKHDQYEKTVLTILETLRVSK